jgi:alkylation response protein AidB-like acyl-CoA dehydrogenase
MPSVLPFAVPGQGSAPSANEAAFEARINAQADSLAGQLAATAVARDQAGGHAAAERELIRASGLLALTIPREHGGEGGSWPLFYRVVRRLAQADSALAHVFAFHHLQLATVMLYGTPAQQEQLFRETVAQRLFWGNAINSQNKFTVALSVPGGFELHGSKGYSSGSVGSDRITVSGWHEASQSFVIVAVPTARKGITVVSDWDAFGQRQTDSGTVQFDHVQVAASEVLEGPGQTRRPRATLRTLLSQLILTNLYTGIALGAFNEARQQLQTSTRPWFLSTAATASQDPFIQHRLAGLWLLVRPAVVLADAAAAQLQEALDAGEAVTETRRGEVAIAVIEAKALAHKAAVNVSSQFFELTGARSTTEKLGLDRFWRNARVHTLHDPIDYKLRDLGRYLLEGEFPEPTSYT